MAGVQAVTFVLNLALRVALGHCLDDVAFGELTFAPSVGLICSTLGELGLNPTVVKEVARSPERSGAYLGSGLFLRIVFGLPLYGIFFSVTRLWQTDSDFRGEDAGAHCYFGDRAAGYHCGYRTSFAIWSIRTYSFGFYNFVRIHRNPNGWPATALHNADPRLPPVTKLLLAMAIGRSSIAQLLTLSIRGIVTTSDGLGFHDASVTYSASSSMDNSATTTAPARVWFDIMVPSAGSSSQRGLAEKRPGPFRSWANRTLRQAANA